MNDWRAIGALARLDLRRWLTSPAALAGALLPPLAMALLLAVLSVSVTEQPVALVVEAHGPYALRMEALLRADEEAYFLRVTDAAGAERLLASQEVAAIITIPADFDRRATEHAALLHLKLNNVDIDFADDIRRSVERSAGEFDAPALRLDDEPAEPAEEAGKPKEENDTANKDKPQGKPGDPKNEPEEEDETTSGAAAPYVYTVEPKNNPYNIQVEEHDLRVTNVDFLHYQLVPTLVLLVLNIGMTGTALLCAEDRARGMTRLLTVMPVSFLALVGGRLLGGVLTSLSVLVPVIVVCLATHVIVVPENHWLALSVLLLMIALCAAGMGIVLGTALRGVRNVAMAASILATYLFLMGGGFTTIAFLPRWLRAVSALDPMHYAIDGLREALFYPDLTGLAANVAVLIGTAIAAVLGGAALAVRSWGR